MRHSLLLFLSLVLVLSLATPGDARKNKKKQNKKNKKKKLTANSPRCDLSHGTTQGECDALASKGCPYKWVGSCSNPASDGAGGCQKINDCTRMRCPNTCNANGNCHWDYNTKSCAVGLNQCRFCQVEHRGDGDDINIDPNNPARVFANTSSQHGAAFACSSSKTTSNWYFLVNDNPGETYGDWYWGISPGPFNLTVNPDLFTSWSYNPTLNPAGGFWFDGEYVWSDLQYETDGLDNDCYTYMDLSQGDIVGVHLDQANKRVRWSLNGIPNGCWSKTNVSTTLEYYGGVIFDNGYSYDMTLVGC